MHDLADLDSIRDHLEQALTALDALQQLEPKLPDRAEAGERDE